MRRHTSTNNPPALSTTRFCVDLSASDTDNCGAPGKMHRKPQKSFRTSSGRKLPQLCRKPRTSQKTWEVPPKMKRTNPNAASGASPHHPRAAPSLLPDVAAMRPPHPPTLCQPPAMTSPTGVHGNATSRPSIGRSVAIAAEDTYGMPYLRPPPSHRVDMTEA